MSKCHKSEHTHIRFGFKHNNPKKGSFQAAWFTITKEYWGVDFDKRGGSYTPTVTYASTLFEFWPTKKSWLKKHSKSDYPSELCYPYYYDIKEASQFGPSNSLEWDSARAAARRMVGEFNKWFVNEYGIDPPESFWEVAEEQAPD